MSEIKKTATGKAKKTGRNKKLKIAIFASGWSSRIVGDYIEGLQEELKKVPSDLFMFINYSLYSMSAEENRSQTNINELPDLKDFDYAIIYGNTLSIPGQIEQITERAKKAGIPLICQGRVLEDTYSIVSEYDKGMRELCEHVVKHHGAKKIIFLGGGVNNPDSDMRRDVLKSVMKENGLELTDDCIYHTQWDNEISYNQTVRAVSEHGKPDAVVCANDGIAMFACFALADRGYEVPGDVIVTGFDHVYDAQIFYPSITTVDPFSKRIGIEGGKIIKKIEAGKKVKPISSVVCRFSSGESCGCGCKEAISGDVLRRQAGRQAIKTRSASVYLDRQTQALEKIVAECDSVRALKKLFKEYVGKHHEYEGSEFYALVDSKLEASIDSDDMKMHTSGYPRELEAVFSIRDDKYVNVHSFNPKKLVPGYNGKGPNRLYTFLALYDGPYSVGYLVFVDVQQHIYDRTLQQYQGRMNMAISKYRQATKFTILNRKLSELTQKDPLTHVKSRAAYEAKLMELERLVSLRKDYKFAIGMFDVNNLKQVNDIYGHDAGDAYLILSCRLICDSFVNSPVYRIGGDEFVAVLSGNDYEHREELLEKLRKNMEELSKSELPLYHRPSIASGLSEYIRGKDGGVDDVKHRADQIMYENKRIMKNGGDVR